GLAGVVGHDFAVAHVAGEARILAAHDDLAVERRLVDAVHAGGREVEELLVAFLADVHAVGAAAQALAEPGEVVAPGFDELAIGVEDAGAVAGGGGIVNEDPAVLALDDRVGVAVPLAFGQLAPAGDQLVGVLALAEDDRLIAGFVVGQDRRGG